MYIPLSLSARCLYDSRSEFVERAAQPCWTRDLLAGPLVHAVFSPSLQVSTYVRVFAWGICSSM